MSLILEHTRTTLPPTATPAEEAAVAAALAQALAPKDIEFRGVTATLGAMNCPVCNAEEPVALPMATGLLVRELQAFAARHVRCIIRAAAQSTGGSE